MMAKTKIYVPLQCIKSLALLINEKARTKGQLILKGYFGFFNSPKKRTQYFCPSRLRQQFEFSSLYIFWENCRHQKDTSKLTDLYLHNWIESILKRGRGADSVLLVLQLYFISMKIEGKNPLQKLF